MAIALRDGDAEVQRETLMRVAEMDPVPAALAPSLLRYLHHEDIELRQAAVKAMGALGKDGYAYRGDMQQALDQEESQSVRDVYEESLQRIHTAMTSPDQ